MIVPMSTTLPLPGICLKLKHAISTAISTARFKPPLSSSARPPLLLSTKNIATTPNVDVDVDVEGFSLSDYFQQSTDLLVRSSDGGPPRWFSPLECANSHLNNSPLLLSLPGVDGSGLSLLLHHHRLGDINKDFLIVNFVDSRIFDIWCLHIPTADRTPFTELVKLVERTIRSENCRFPNRPIYIAGESVGGCLALAVAAHIPHIDLVLLVANSATSFSKSQLHPLLPILKIMPHYSGLPYVMSLMTGVPSSMVMSTAQKGLPSAETVTYLSEAVTALLSYLSDVADVLTVEMVLWKLKMVESACAYSNSRLHSVSAQTLILSSGNDQLLPSLQEGERLRKILPNCQIRTFFGCGHALFLEEDFDLVTVIKGAGFYRRAKHKDYAYDFLPPSPREIKSIVDASRWLDVATSPVMLSTLEDGKIVRSLSGIPSQGPVLFVGYHNMLGLEVAPMIRRFLVERNIVVRGVAHPMLFKKPSVGRIIMPDLATFDVARVLGAVPVSASNLYKLFSMKSHVLLYPGGVREALHRKGEEYKLIWPEQSEFVRMAARFGATIIPFGAVGEDDFAQLVLDYDDEMKIPFVKEYVEEISQEYTKMRTEMEGEIANQDLHFPILLPKVPGRYYYLFGKPIITQGRREELRNKERAHQVYEEVKREVEKCLCYCKTKREDDPYRNIIQRFMYQATHGPESQVPTFDLD
ncbi:hypothetical protein OSB04_007731 [Centaurea solstitialis]|uniref:AB hydrolase-1 domain-containing protein n=1 Tax=Centaurea solstitialis TaxID=347529 RepID=A0AA38TVY0_9ASTR|nr:hypothetical protein OSB04_007731 [Centaurea solstitialis]